MVVPILQYEFQLRVNCIFTVQSMLKLKRHVMDPLTLLHRAFLQHTLFTPLLTNIFVA